MSLFDFLRARAPREAPKAPPGGFAVVDLETTGLYPGGHDRIVEIAIVRLEPALAVSDEWTTLVDPQRDIGARSIHGVSARDVVGAPTFRDIAGDVQMRLANTVVVGHNVSFDLRFLRAEFERCGWPATAWNGLCTLQLADLVGRGDARRLQECCREEGIAHLDAHTALGDARAAAELLRCYLPRLDPRLLAEVMPAPVLVAGATFAPSGLARPREQRAPVAASSLNRLLKDVPSPTRAVEAEPAAVLGYLDLLDRVVEDRVVTEQETAALADLAAAHGLSAETVADLHRSYLTSLVAIALRDEVLTDVEGDDLTCLAAALGQTDFLAQLLGAATPAVRTALTSLRAVAHAASHALPPIDRRQEMRGKMVCFTGESVCGFSREQQEMLAIAAGMKTWPRLTKGVEVLVLADPASQSAKARKAVEYGTRQIAERAFWPGLGVTIT